MPQHVFESCAIVGNPYSYPQVKTLMEGVTVGGHRLSDQKRVLNIADASQLLLKMVEARSFDVEITTFIALQRALKWKNGPDAVYHTLDEVGAIKDPLMHKMAYYQWHEENKAMIDSLDAIAAIKNTMERAMACFLYGAMHDCLLPGKLMADGVLMSAGVDALSLYCAVPVLNEQLARFHESRDGTELMSTLLDCLRPSMAI